MEEEKKALKPKSYQMTREEEKPGMNFLRSKHLAQNTLKAIEKSGTDWRAEKRFITFFSLSEPPAG